MSASLALLVASSNGFTPIIVNVDDVDKTLYANNNYWTSGSTLKMPSSSGTYLSETP